MRLCSARSKVRCAQPHLFLQATWVQRGAGQGPAGCCPCCLSVGEVRCRGSPVSSPHRRDWCKVQFLNRRTEIEIVCRLNDILLLFQMLQPGQLIPPGNTSASHLPPFLRAAWSPGCSLHRSKYCPLYQRITTENLLGSNSPISVKFHAKSWTAHRCDSLWDPDLQLIQTSPAFLVFLPPHPSARKQVAILHLALYTKGYWKSPKDVGNKEHQPILNLKKTLGLCPAPLTCKHLWATLHFRKM